MPEAPKMEQEVAIVYPDGDMLGRIARTENGLAVIMWNDNPIEDWVEVGNLTWNPTSNRWEMDPEG